MKAQHFILSSALVASCSAVCAQLVKGNEAVMYSPTGAKLVDTPPLAATASRSNPCGAESGCHAGPWHMVETSDGLRECTEPFARPSTCRASTYGAQKRSRLWIVKKNGIWLWCQYPDLSSYCKNMNAKMPLNLPVSAVQ